MNTVKKIMDFSSALNKIDETYGKITVLDNGIASGRLIEIFGDESSQKIKLTLIAIAEVQIAGGIAAFIDVKHDFDRNYAEELGVDIENLIISQPDNDNEALEVSDNLIRCGAIDIVVVGSTSQLTI